MTNVYIARHARLPIFKIGKSGDVPARIASMGNRYFRPGTIFVFKTNSDHDAINLEGLLHKSLCKYEWTNKGGLPGNGRTEWYSTNALSTVEELANVFSKIIKFELCEIQHQYCPATPLDNSLALLFRWVGNVKAQCLESKITHEKGYICIDHLPPLFPNESNVLKQYENGLKKSNPQHRFDEELVLHIIRCHYPSDNLQIRIKIELLNLRQARELQTNIEYINTHFSYHHFHIELK